MAQKIRVTLIDDIDGTPADVTVPFTFDGKSYEIDLSSQNAARLREDLAPYLQAARLVGPGSRQRSTARARANRARSSQIRAWARQRGHQVSQRGRIPASIIRQYESHGAHGAVAGPSPGPDFEDDE
jgi:nucleoid-associated protein Lsr2